MLGCGMQEGPPRRALGRCALGPYMPGRAVDRLTAEERSRLMSRIRGKDIKPKMAVRRLVHGMRFRYGPCV